MTMQPIRIWSSEEYLAFERTSEVKHTFFDGVIVAMAGASAAHNIITANIVASLHFQVRQRNCTVFPSDMRLKIETTRTYTYPDIMVVCGDIQYAHEAQDTLENPTVIIEVLSPSTEIYDRGKKAQIYRTIPSLQEYLLVAQDGQHVEHFVRYAEHQWLFTECADAQTPIMLPSIECTLLFEDIYAKVPPSSPAQG
ncbi:Uma2 family endonuclease [Candidatus Oscillochloris fontis]|uniref:Uma2 family endonuclease n=1 Tax=Candidatus Oscillochloris fontis TaxID=2496868 RepID=UPI00101B8AEA|nr:Uma2 family endonuclease [Candidatus Oscillochloris fontis]